MKRVLIIGAGMLQVPVIKKSVELGYYTISVDGNPEAEGFEFCDEYRCIDIINQEECLGYAREQKIDGVLTAATDYGVLTAAYIAEKLNLTGLEYKVAQVIKNKYMVRKTLSDKGIDSIPQFFMISGGDSASQIAKKAKFPLIVKPCDGSGSKGVSCVHNQEEFVEACDEAIGFSVSGKCMAESFITGDEYGVESFVDNGNVHVLTVMKKRMTAAPDYAELGHSVPCGLSENIENKIKKYVSEVIKALEINTGSVNMDLLLTKDERVFVVDIGARMGGNLIGSHIVPLYTGIDYIANMLRLCVGEKCDYTGKQNSKAVATAILALTPGRITAVPDMNVYLTKDGVNDIIFNKDVGDVIRTYHNNLDGCGYVVAEGNSAETAIKTAEGIRTGIDEAIVR